MTGHRDDRSFFSRLVAVSASDLAAVDEPVIIAASGRCLFDFLACVGDGILGVPRIQREIAHGESGHTDVLVDDPSLLMSSAIEMATAAHIRDLDDVHWSTLTHPGSFVLPTLVAGWAAGPVRRDLRHAAAFGYQVTARLASALPSAHRNRYHLAATAGTIGATAGLAYLLDLGDDAMVDAMLHVASSIGHGAAAVRSRSRTLVHHRATATALACISVQQSGLGPPVANPWSAYEDAALDYSTAALDHKHPPAVASVTRRRHAVTGFSHSMVDLLQDLYSRVTESRHKENARQGLDILDDIERIEVEVPSFVALIGHPGPPRNAHEAAWHLPTIAASAMSDRTPVSITWPLQLAASRLAGRVVIVERQTHPPDLRVTARVVLRGGDEVSDTRDVPYGHPLDPWPDRELIAKAACGRRELENDLTPAFDRLISIEVPVSLGDLRTVLAIAACPVDRGNVRIPPQPPELRTTSPGGNRDE